VLGHRVDERPELIDGDVDVVMRLRLLRELLHDLRRNGCSDVLEELRQRDADHLPELIPVDGDAKPRATQSNFTRRRSATTAFGRARRPPATSRTSRGSRAGGACTRAARPILDHLLERRPERPLQTEIDEDVVTLVTPGLLRGEQLLDRDAPRLALLLLEGAQHVELIVVVQLVEQLARA
jgi:hypothetical protein